MVNFHATIERNHETLKSFEGRIQGKKLLETSPDTFEYADVNKRRQTARMPLSHGIGSAIPG